MTCNTCYLRYMFSDLYMNLKLSLTVILKTINHYFKTTINIEASQAGLYWMPKISCHLWGSTSINWPEVFINWEKAMAPHSSTLAWKIPWTEEPGRLQSMRSLSRTQLSDFTFTFLFHALEKEMATHSSIRAWRIPGTGEPGGLPCMGLHRVRHDWNDLAAAAEQQQQCLI